MKRAGDAMACTLSRGQLAAHAGMNAVSGGVTGAATDYALHIS